jgi:hypothetical protein
MEKLKNEFAKMLSDKVAAVGTEMDEGGNRAIDGNQLKLDNIWGQLMIKVRAIYSAIIKFTYIHLGNSNF